MKHETETVSIRFKLWAALSPANNRTLAQNKDEKKDEIRRLEFEITMSVHLFHMKYWHGCLPKDIYKWLGSQIDQNWPSFVIVVHVDLMILAIENPELAFFISS